MTASSIEQPADLDVVRASYDRVADKYVAMNLGDITTYPWLRTAIDGFAAAVQGLGPVLDVGCGPGDITAYLAARGLDVSGVDLSPQMISHARDRHPDLTFSIASATELNLPDSSLGGIVAWWSLFNLPRDVLPTVLASFAQALVPGGHLIFGTHVGDTDLHRTEAYGGVPVTWTTHLYQPEILWPLLTAAGLTPVADLRLPESIAGVPSLVLVAQRRTR
jgi:ubiquinone/menaquinone biosynthesis C-methylase UbiE